MPPTPGSPSGHGQNRGPGMVAVCATTLAIAAVLVVLRLYARVMILRKLWWDDLFVSIGLCITIIAFAFLVESVDAGTGQHIFDLLPWQISRALKFELLWRVSMGISMMFTRVSIGLLMLRFSATKRWFDIMVYSVICLIIASHIPLAVVASHRCDPVKKYWMPDVPGHCLSLRVTLSFGFLNAAVSIASDFTLSALPIFFLWNVKISMRTKIEICCLMGVGVLVGACAIVRAAYGYEFDTADITYIIFDLVVCFCLENNLGIIAACIPTLKPLFLPLKAWLRSLTSSKGAYTEHTEETHRLSTILPTPKSQAGQELNRSKSETRSIGPTKTYDASGSEASLGDSDGIAGQRL